MILIGTSGYNYPEWKGSFYPVDLPASKMLPYYAQHFSTVEINYSFYRLPSEKNFQQWSQATPDGFLFTLKAPRRITHDMRLQNCEDLLSVFCSRAQSLGPKLGILLFQLPPSFRKNVAVLRDFLRLVPSGLRAAFEFRHDSWHSDEVFALLRDKRCSLCITDTDKATTPLVATADYIYLRLRDEGYEEADVIKWADACLSYAAKLQDVFVYFKHEEQGKGAEFARIMMEYTKGQSG